MVKIFAVAVAFLALSFSSRYREAFADTCECNCCEGTLVNTGDPSIQSKPNGPDFLYAKVTPAGQDFVPLALDLFLPVTSFKVRLLDGTQVILKEDFDVSLLKNFPNPNSLGVEYKSTAAEFAGGFGLVRILPVVEMGVDTVNTELRLYSEKFAVLFPASAKKVLTLEIVVNGIKLCYTGVWVPKGKAKFDLTLPPAKKP